MSLVCNLLIRAVTDPHTCLTSSTSSPLRSSSVHVHVFLHGLSLVFQNLFGDFPLLDHGNLVDVHDRVSPILSTSCNSDWSSSLHLLCLILRNLLDEISVFSDWAFLKLLADGQELIGWSMARFRRAPCFFPNV